ncbi:pilus assembly protein N-terminal domain-containing protein [Aquamicrobium zhengzhouense]|uniref:Pilus assembly protein N-terminal domain-containing protein n=1 Tax=Aquamicrobium zhengzhouense TaxID=2781738 RepID=A0ABS0SC98_9HYPH|nr:pilus assembly protein N-terminal domain-containing protein [Aquamicrobium zhengzhouense]MBI1620923.1 pilus assembly protein N-terminal domain-containing protein [Aquamicrobium zhengzhouense]
MLRQVSVYLSSAILGMAVATLMVGAASAEPIMVEMNQARIVKLARAADTIIIGNPNIADASVQDASTLVLTGKGFGVTNMVVIDADGEVIVDEQIAVSRNTANTVRVYRRAQVQTLSCSPFCEGAYMNEAEQQAQSAQNFGH